MNLEEMDEKNASHQDDERQFGSPLKRILIGFVIGFFVYVFGYILLFKTLGEPDTWTEYYFENEKYLYAEELTLTDFSWHLPEPLSLLLSSIYYPAMEIDGTRVEIEKEEQDKVTRLFKKYLANQVQRDVRYYVTYDEESITASEHNFLVEGEWLYEEFDEEDNPGLQSMAKPAVEVSR